MVELNFDTVIFDLDGVITQTAKVHAFAWKKAFDEYLKLREKRDGEAFREFTHEEDYLTYVDGKPRYQGVQSFLESRGINISFGDPSDAADTETVCGIGNRKNEAFTEILESDGVQIYDTSVAFIKALKEKGIRIGVASSSKNCKLILETTGLLPLFETRVDGVVSAELGLKGKPEGDIFVTAARNLGKVPSKAVVVEDAVSGVQAGRNGGFGLVLGIARHDNVAELNSNGADLVVKDLGDISIEWINSWFARTPSILESTNNVAIEDKNKIVLNDSYSKKWDDIIAATQKFVFFLDYDGTLTPIVDTPDLAVLSDDMRELVKQVAQKHTVAVVSGRMREDVEKLVGVDNIFYAGSHGFDIKGPQTEMIHRQVKGSIPLIEKVIDQLTQELDSIEGVLIEKKKFSTAVHYRLVDESNIPQIQQAVENSIEKYEGLKLLRGKKVFEILPDIDWDKGKAVRWIMETLGIEWNNGTTVVYIGDDTTDEFAFRYIRTRGCGILVADSIKPSAADYYVNSVDDVKTIFTKVINNA